jgi:tetratricopeptide (TPR) repeat protein
MKKQILFFSMLLISSMFYAQSTADSLVRVGVNYHDSGQYDQAIEVYKKALELEPDSPLIHYEISMTYMYSKEFKKSIEHSDEIIKMDDKFLLEAYITKGSSLDYIGKTKEAIKLLKKGVKKFGDHHLLYYNMALAHYNARELEDAEDNLISAIQTNSNHSSSHLLLGFIMQEKNQRIQSLLCIHYFLLLEPNSSRAEIAYKSLQEQSSGNVHQDKDKPNQINIVLDADKAETEFGAADLMLSMLEASKSIEENKDKSEEELFIENTTSFFKVLGELKEDKNSGLWWEFYIPFLYDLAKSEHMDAYCYYISQSSNEKALNWIEQNTVSMNKFSAWLARKK